MSKIKLLCCFLLTFLVSCESTQSSSIISSVESFTNSQISQSSSEGESMNQINIKTNDEELTLELLDNSSTAALKQMILEHDNSLTITMNDYGGFEKVGRLPNRIVSNDTQITTSPNDVVLYQSNQLVIFYGSNSWSYTRLGKITNVTPSELKEVLNGSSIQVTLEIK